MTFTLTPFSNDAPEAQSTLPWAPQLRSGGGGQGAGLESSLFLQVTASDRCSSCAQLHRLEVQQECPVILGEGTAGSWALCPDTYGHTSSDQEESMTNSPLSLARRRLVWLWKFAKRPRGDTAQVPRAGWAGGKQVRWLPGAARAAVSLSCSGAALALASLAICSHLDRSVATEGWHCPVLCVLPFLPRSGPWTVKNSATHSSWLAWLPALRGRCLGHPAGPAYLTPLGFLSKLAG